jgi:acyl carrier protein
VNRIEDVNAVVRAAIFSAIEEVNRGLSPESRLEKTVETVLFGPGGRLDSLNSVNLVLGVEEKISEAFDVQVGLAEAMVAEGDGDFPATVGGLVDFVCQKISRRGPDIVSG